MSKSFWDKLNVAVRASMPSIGRSEGAHDKGSSKGSVNDLQQEVARLRKRIDEAMQYEDELQKQLDQYYSDVAEWDEKADQAVRDGKDDQARFAIQRLDHAQKQLTFTEADLREHRYLTQDLMAKVNNLEAVLQEAGVSESHATSSSDLDTAVESISGKVSSIYSDIQGRMNDLFNNESKQAPSQAPSNPEAKTKVPISSEPEKRSSGDDLDNRVSRLSKPEDVE